MNIKKKSYNKAAPIEKAVGLYMPFHCDNCIRKLRVSQESYGYGMVCPYCKTGVICPSPSFHAGETIGPYRIDGWLARGAMGEVYYAHALQTERTVALKVLNTDVDGTYAFRLFEQEAYIMDHFEHPCLPQLASFNKHHNYYFLAMNYVEGEGLDTILLREGPFDQIYILDMIIRLADLLDHVWRKFGAIHRDIKPANIMMTEDDQLVLIDWGLAHIYNHPIENDTDITFGTPEYICPAIVRGEINPDYRTDIYSLGATCFHLVTGVFPFHSDDADNVIDLVLAGNAPNAHEANPKVSPELAKLLTKMMALSYDDRYQNWESLVEDVEKVKMFLSL